METKKDLLSKEIEQAEKQMLLEKYKTAMKKAKFIAAMKNGLSDEIKKNPGRAHIHKKTKFQRFMVWLKSIFTKF